MIRWLYRYYITYKIKNSSIERRISVRQKKSDIFRSIKFNIYDMVSNGNYLW